MHVCWRKDGPGAPCPSLGPEFSGVCRRAACPAFPPQSHGTRFLPRSRELAEGAQWGPDLRASPPGGHRQAEWAVPSRVAGR